MENKDVLSFYSSADLAYDEDINIYVSEVTAGCSSSSSTCSSCSTCAAGAA